METCLPDPCVGGPEFIIGIDAYYGLFDIINRNIAINFNLKHTLL